MALFWRDLPNQKKVKIIIINIVAFTNKFSY